MRQIIEPGLHAPGLLSRGDTQWLVDAGADINHKRGTGNTPLHSVAVQCNMKDLHFTDAHSQGVGLTRMM